MGIDLTVVERGLEITRIYPGSSAADTGMVNSVPLREHDRIIRIDQQIVQDMRPEDAAEPARGVLKASSKLKSTRPAIIPPCAAYR